MGLVVGIDPGKHASGVALFRYGTLIWCGLMDAPNQTPYRADRVVLEHMQVDARTRGKVQSVIDCQLGGALIAGSFRPLELRTVKPREWKGSTPKPVHHRRIRAALTDPESSVLAHALAAATKKAGLDIVDAVGLGLWDLGRITK